MITEELLKKIILASNDASKAPWKSYYEGRDHNGGSNIITTGSDDEEYFIEFTNIRIEDQDFIAMSRNVVPELVEEIIRLRKILEEHSIPIE